MNISKRTIASVAIAAATLYLPLAAHAELSPKKLLEKVYGGFDKKHDCWLAMDSENNQRYCMKFVRSDKISSETGQRLYVMVAGDAVDNEGTPNGSHVTAGLVGAFVVEEKNGQVEIVAGDAKIPMGASGVAPVKWKFIKLGASDYWGWQTTWGDCHQGQCGSRYSILAPSGKKIRELAGFAAEFSNGGACMDKRCEINSASIESKLEVDATRINEKVFPLEVTVSGRDKGKKIAPKTWTIPFNSAKWSYLEPKDWPLKNADF